ncbi:MAG: type II secretion system protein [Planctomycetota bacterium]
MSYRLGFTLVELTLVIAILAVLAALVLPRFADATQDASETAAQTNLAIIQRQVDKYHGMHGEYPGDVLSDWFVGGTLPANPLADFDTASVVEVQADGNADQTEPADKVMTAASTSAWWYNPGTGQVRARIKVKADPVESLLLYNRVNGVNANSLADLIATRDAARAR